MKDKKWWKLGALTVAAVAVLAVFAGCGSEKKSSQGAASDGTKKVLTYRRLPTATSDLFDAGIKPILEKKGYTLKGVSITDSVQREMALDEGAIDFHVDAHFAYLKAINASKGTHLMGAVAVPTVPEGLYPGQKKTLAEVADGDTIAIPNDASNLARSYQLLEGLGWIKLDPKKDRNQVTGNDVIANPKHLKFKEMTGPTIANIREDVAYVILRGSDAYNAKIDFNSALFQENDKDIAPEMRMALCINSNNKDAQWVKDIVAAYKSPEFKEFMKTQGKFWITPDYMK
ncbi:MAG: D-methionine transport system substrate-binding protein [Succiniclasticum sp.]|jgi:D-methionine transport system substrate-binding protein